jgi:C4-dicarboxylate transporter DctM subunit
MTPEMTGVVGFIVLLVLIALRIPVGISMIVVGFAGIWLLLGAQAGANILGVSPFTTEAAYTISVVPLFILMGNFASYAGVTKGAYDAIQKWVGQLPGGLAIATIGGCAGFAACCGSTVATAASMCKIALPQMLEHRYDAGLSTGSIAAGGTLGILIPPSLLFVFYGIITQESVGKLFIAGILPGILLTCLFMVAIYITVKLKPQMSITVTRASWGERLKGTKDLWGVAVLFLIVMGGIWQGIFTPTEAGAIGCFFAFILLLVNKRCTRRNLAESFEDTALTVGMIAVVFIGAMIFSYFMAVTKLPMALSNYITMLPFNSYGILAIIILMYIILGCFFEGVAMLLLTLPIIFPTIVTLGFDPIWFGVIIVLMMETAAITPPVGINAYVIAGMVKEMNISMSTVFRGIVPFFIAIMVCVAILIAFPRIALFLPSTMMG